MGQNHPVSCCGSKCGQPTILSIGEDVCPPKQPRPDGDQPGLNSADAVPEWLSELAPSLAGEEAERAADAWVRCGEELRRRTRQFVRRAICGIPCRLIDQKTGRAVPASYALDENIVTLMVESITNSAADPEATANNDGGQMPPDTARRTVRECQIADMRNIWVCSDSELARRAHGALRHGTEDADLACVMLIDAPSGPIALVERSSEAREEFLDCMAVLIAAQRLRSEPEVACCKRAEGPPPPEARLRPYGKSLQSIHISGPICVWLAQAGDDVLPEIQVPGLPGIDIYNLQAQAGQQVISSDPEGRRGAVPLMTPKWPSARGRSNTPTTGRSTATGRSMHGDHSARSSGPGVTISGGGPVGFGDGSLGEGGGPMGGSSALMQQPGNWDAMPPCPPSPSQPVKPVPHHGRG